MTSALVAAAALIVVNAPTFIQARRAAVRTKPNGHGPLPEAVGTIIEQLTVVDDKVNGVIRWQTKHQVQHEFADSRTDARLDAGADLMRRIESRLDDGSG